MRQTIGLAIVAGCVVMAAVSGCTTSGSENSMGSSQVVEIPAGSFAGVWRNALPMQGKTVSQIWLNDDMVFVQTSDNHCFCILRRDGHAVSYATAAAPTDTVFAPVTYADRIVFPSTKHLSVFDRSGGLKHRIPLQYSCSSSGVGAGPYAFVGLDHPNGGRLAAIDTKAQPYTITPWWELMTRGQVSATPAVFNQVIFTGSRDGSVYAVRSDSREVVWSELAQGHFRTGGEILADLKADRTGVYVASMDTKFYCLKPDSGRIGWVYHSGRPLRETSTPLVTADSVYLYVPTVGVVAIDKAGTAEIRSHRWAVAEGRQVLSYDDKYIYLRADGNRIIAADKQTGQVEFRSSRSDFDHFVTNESAKDNTIFAATTAGTVYAIRPVLSFGFVGELVMANP